MKRKSKPLAKVGKLRSIQQIPVRPKSQLKTDTIYCGDNLQMLKEIPTDSVDLIYIDPPFNSNRNYEVFWGDNQEKRAFNDRFGDASAYIAYMRPRIIELHRVLKKTGSFYYHCDWHASHYVKVLLDQVFDGNNFRNEIIWKRTTAHSDSKTFGNGHDTIFFYTKSEKFHFNKIYQPYSEEYIKRFKNIDKDGRRWQDDNLTAKGLSGGGYEYEYKGAKSLWRCPLETMQKLDKENRLHFTKTGGIRLKRFLDESKGLPCQSVWDDVNNINSQSSERVGYPTQKPIPLLERIITASSNTGETILDAFCGCGTTLIAAQKLNRRWIGIDISPTACRVMSQRLWDIFRLSEGRDFYVEDLKKTEAELRCLPHFEFQNWACIALGGIPNKRKSGDFGIDGKLYPIEIGKKKKEGKDLFGDADFYYPIQVKQVDKAGRPDIDNFETAVRRDGRSKGYFVAFDFSSDAITEIKRLDKEGDIEIVPVTVKRLLEMENIYRVKAS